MTKQTNVVSLKKNQLYLEAFRHGRAVAILGGKVEDNPHKLEKCPLDKMCLRHKGWIDGFKSISR